MTKALKIYPTIEQCEINNDIKCPIEGCNEKYTSESNLNLHITKTHRRENLDKSQYEKQYFCPILSCSWNDKKHFTKLKNLRQHYFKVHKEKSFNCSVCQKAFVTKTLLVQHKIFCTVKFTCQSCKAAYDCYNTLKTHARRKCHKILEKSQYKLKGQQTSVEQDPSVSKIQSIPAVLIFANTGTQLNNQSTVSENKMTQVGDFSLDQFLLLQSTQTETISNNVLQSVQTQTINNPIDIKHSKPALMENYKNINTQTDPILANSSSFHLENLDNTFGRNEIIKKNTSSTQTCIPQDIYPLTPSGIVMDGNSNSLNSFVEGFNCNSMETQTDLMFENDIFNSDYYTNMYTQTCDELLNSLSNYNDNQTQTQSGFNDDEGEEGDSLLHSVHSQTLMTCSLDSQTTFDNIIKDIVHSETQTDEEFRQMFELIN